MKTLFPDELHSQVPDCRGEVFQAVEGKLDCRGEGNLCEPKLVSLRVKVRALGIGVRALTKVSRQ